MAVDMFLRIEGLDGESEDSKNKGQIQIMGWDWEASQTGTSGVGGGMGAGKVEHKDLVIRKFVDRASPVLYQFCCGGDHIKSADLTVRKAGGEALDYLVIHLEDLIITSFVLGGEPKNDQVEETIRINFTRASISYTPQGGTGAGGGNVVGGWDVKANSKYSAG
jgi:type VI secretion system secreted protein Hcp